MKNKLFIGIFLLFMAGFANAAYIAIETAQKGSIACYVVQGCDQVLTSSYAHIGGIAVSWWGIAFYLGGIALLFASQKKERIKRFFGWYMVLGLAATLWFIYVQAFIVRAFCSACLISALIVISIFLLTGAYRKVEPPVH